MQLSKMSTEELRELVRECAREIAHRKELERRKQAKPVVATGFKKDLLDLAKRAGLSEDELRALVE